nr:PREDICTED: clarin-1 [Apteryx mantelli mantelli]
MSRKQRSRPENYLAENNFAAELTKVTLPINNINIMNYAYCFLGAPRVQAPIYVARRPPLLLSRLPRGADTLPAGCSQVGFRSSCLKPKEPVSSCRRNRWEPRTPEQGAAGTGSCGVRGREGCDVQPGFCTDGDEAQCSAAAGRGQGRHSGVHDGAVFPDLLQVIPASIHVSVIVFCTALVAVALVGTGFFLYNAFGSPYETLHGPAGLYLCSFIACSCGCLILVLFSSEVKVHHLSEKIANFKEESFTFKTHSEQFDSSFWIILVCSLVHFLNAILIRFAGFEFPFSKPKDSGTTTGAADLMY